MWRLIPLVPMHVDYPPIAPVSDDVRRPKWSVMIPTFNCATYLERTLKSVLAQDPGPAEMQIMIVDDHSTQDDSETVANDIGKGRVAYFRHPENVGAPQNFNTCIRLAVGHWVHILHGDDLILPGFYAAYGSFIEKYPEVGMVFGRACLINIDDERIGISPRPPEYSSSERLHHLLEALVIANFIFTPTVVVARNSYVQTGGFTSFLPHTADWEMWMRLAASGPIGYIDDAYALYRMHPESDTRRFVRSARNIEDFVKVIEIGIRRLPPELRRQARATAYHGLEGYANKCRRVFHRAGQHRSALCHGLWAFRIDPSALNLWRITRSGLRCLLAGQLARPS
jgi:glycosyltransferase involved in cell wall biosynthesis